MEDRRHRLGTSLRILYLLIGGVGVIAAVGTIAYPDAALFREFGANLATESLALVITLAVVRRILDRQERNRRLRASVGALRKAARSLRVVADRWAELVKGSLPRVPAERPTSYEELLASHYTEALTWLDADSGTTRGGAAAPGIGAPGSGSKGAASSEVSLVRSHVRAILESRQMLASLTQAYAVVLDGDYVEALEAVVDDRFTALAAELEALDVDPSIWRRRLNLARGPRESCFRALLLAIRLHNRLAAEAATQRSEHLLPRAEMLDIALSLEDDLMVDTTLPPSFWSGAPLPGSLRARDTRPTPPRRGA